MVFTKAVLIAIYAICHADNACIESVKDLTPESKEEVVMAYESLYGDRSGVCQ